MPPALSDDESGSSSTDEIPFKKDVVDDTQAADEDEDEGEDEYVVEKVLNHRWDPDAAVMKYEIKWQGYEKKADRTWEPEENLEGARDAVEAYFKKIGGRPEPPASGSKRKRRSEVADSSTPEAKGSARGRKKSKTDQDEDTPFAIVKKKKNWTPPVGSWETHIMDIETITENRKPGTGEKELIAYVCWNEGNKSMHNLAVLKQKCPQKLIDYFEQHLVFRTTESAEETRGAPEAEMVDVTTNGDL